MKEDKKKSDDYRAFFDMSHDLMLRVGRKGDILEVNKRWYERLGGGQGRYTGRDWLEAVHPEDHALVHERLNASRKRSMTGGGEIRLQGEDGSDVWVKWEESVDEDGEQRYLVFKDISIQKRFEEELHRIEAIDGLSGAYNRRYFLNRAFEELLRSVRYESKISLLLIDIDRLTAVNEGHSQFTGDQVIRKVAQICLKTLRNTDLFGRLGGGEFGCLLVETPLSGAEIIAERIRTSFAENELVLPKTVLPVTVTIGLCHRKEGDVSIEEILKRAQSALQRGKSAGGNCVCISDQ